MTLLLWIIAAFLIGSLPSGYLVTRLLKGIDIRQHGSGNPGATNVFRVVGPAAGIATFVIDGAKGYLPVILAAGFFGAGSTAGVLAQVMVGLAAIAGHIWSVFLSFKGGKGVATGTGVFLALLPVPTLVAAIVFAVVLALSRYVSLGSLAAAFALPVATYLSGEPRTLVVFSAVVFVLIVMTHRSNIQRLRAGRENKVGTQSKSDATGGDHHD